MEGLESVGGEKRLAAGRDKDCCHVQLLYYSLNSSYYLVKELNADQMLR